MIAIALRFPSGRFHATSWNRHVNEGVPEWPPSPWRLLRSIVAAWKIKSSHFTEDEVKPILEQLVTPPHFFLPSATTGHSRHYMRWYKRGPEDQTLVFDSFVCLRREDEIVVHWADVDISENQRQILSALMEKLGYLGRAESWCEARLLDHQEAQNLQRKLNCHPLNGTSQTRDQELIRVLCAHPLDAFDNKYITITKTTGKGKNKQEIKEDLYDPSWHLCIETAQLHKEKWSDPPGSQWISYVRRTDCFHLPAKRVTKQPKTPHIQVVRFALDSTVLPLITQTLPITEETRSRLMGIYGNHTLKRKGGKRNSTIFSGKDSEGKPLKGHGHAYYLPTDEDGDGRLDHLTIVAEDVFHSDELYVLDKLRKLERNKKSPEVQFLLLGMGTLHEFKPFLLSKAQQWVSATPFIVTRHLKKSGRKRDPEEFYTNPQLFVQQVLKEELERFIERYRHTIHFAMDQVKIELLTDEQNVFRIAPKKWNKHASDITFRPLQFRRKRFRKKEGDDGDQRPSGSFRITFPEPIEGPLVLGHSAHFGMGLFLPTCK